MDCDKTGRNEKFIPVFDQSERWALKSPQRYAQEAIDFTKTFV
jgi:hypothetical protein